MNILSITYDIFMLGTNSTSTGQFPLSNFSLICHQAVTKVLMERYYLISCITVVTMSMSQFHHPRARLRSCSLVLGQLGIAVMGSLFKIAPHVGDVHVPVFPLHPRWAVTGFGTESESGPMIYKANQASSVIMTGHHGRTDEDTDRDSVVLCLIHGGI